jgi:arabinose-5-phosphate isomerase
VAITESETSTLGGLADIVLELGPIDEPGPHGLAPTASTMAMLAIGDMLAMVVQEGRTSGHGTSRASILVARWGVA